MKHFKDKVVYEIYPRSFQDSNGDGIGDLPGITSRLDDLKDLGVDVIWLGPIYPSAGADGGYDVSDYRAIDPDFGTMEDFETLVREARARGIDIMMDMVFNHTSSEHAWFRKALAGDPVYQDYYFFRSGKNNDSSLPPTNWNSKFGGSAWQYVPELNQYYLHVFDVRQPDLNWDNPAVRKEAADVVRFWMEKGVRGFRFDVINLISKGEFADDDVWDGRRFYTDGPHIHEYLQELNRNSFGQDEDTITVGEMNSTSLEACKGYASEAGNELDMVFSFHHLKADYEQQGASKEKWVLKRPDIPQFRQILFEWQTGMQSAGSWNALFLNCHDQPRALSRFGDDLKYRDQSGKALANLIHLLRGTPYMYQGEEIGMKNPGFSRLEQYRDVESINAYSIMKERGHSEEETLAILAQKSRDNARTPMQWSNAHDHGFGSMHPWIDGTEDDPRYTLEAQKQDPDSIWNHYRKLIALRKGHEVISNGTITPLDGHHPEVIAYLREGQNEDLLVITSLSDKPADIVLEEAGESGWMPLISSWSEIQPAARTMTLRPFESIAWLKTKA